MSKRCLAGCLIVLLAASAAGCGDAVQSGEVTYELVSSQEMYQGELISETIEQYTYDSDSYDLNVENGQEVSEGTVLLMRSQSGRQTLLDALEEQYDIDAITASLSAAKSELSAIEKGKYSSSSALSAEYAALKEERRSLKSQIEAQQIVIDTAKITYQYELAALEDSLEDAQEAAKEAAASVSASGDAVSASDAAAAESSVSEIEQEIEKCKALYKKEQEANQLTLDDLEDDYEEVSSEIKNYGSSASVTARVSELEQEIAEYEKQTEAYEEQLEEIDSGSICAECDGLVVLEEGVVSVYSNEVQFVFSASTQNYAALRASEEEYSLQYNDEQVGSLTYAYSIPGESDGMYDMVYTISNDTGSKLLTNTYAYMVSEEKIYIPSAYIGCDEDGGYYVMQNGSAVEIEAELSDGQYLLISGLSAGDEIEQID